MNLIQKELELAKDEKLATIDGREDLVALTTENVAKVEAHIQCNSTYKKATDENAVPQRKHNGDIRYGGSTAFWMKRLKHILIDGMEVTQAEYEEVVEGAVAAVDRDNRTHLNADTVGRDEISKRIFQIDKTRLLENLRSPSSTGYELLKKIAEYTHPESVSADNAKCKARRNLSFASKFCHYACFYLFDGSEEQDNYSIWDSVVKGSLRKYLEYYGIEGYKDADFEDYDKYQSAIDQILKKLQNPISRNGFDHLLWYYYK